MEISFNRGARKGANEDGAEDKKNEGGNEPYNKLWNTCVSYANKDLARNTTVQVQDSTVP